MEHRNIDTVSIKRWNSGQFIKISNSLVLNSHNFYQNHSCLIICHSFYLLFLFMIYQLLILFDCSKIVSYVNIPIRKQVFNSSLKITIFFPVVYIIFVSSSLVPYHTTELWSLSKIYHCITLSIQVKLIVHALLV